MLKVELEFTKNLKFLTGSGTEARLLIWQSGDSRPKGPEFVYGLDPARHNLNIPHFACEYS